MERKSMKKKIQRRIDKALALLLAFALVLNVSGVSAFAAAEQEGGNAEINGDVNEDVGGEVNAAAQADDVQITGDGPIGIRQPDPHLKSLRHADNGSVCESLSGPVLTSMWKLKLFSRSWSFIA